MISAFANYAVQTENWQQNALQALTSDKKGLTPEKLLVLQDHVLNYNVEVSLVGALAGKIGVAVETLTRSGDLYRYYCLSCCCAAASSRNY